jgi:hypothetical protein
VTCDCHPELLQQALLLTRMRSAKLTPLTLVQVQVQVYVLHPWTAKFSHWMWRSCCTFPVAGCLAALLQRLDVSLLHGVHTMATATGCSAPHLVAA